MKFLTILLAFWLTGSCAAQTTGWKVFFNKKLVLSATTEDTEKNKISINKADLLKQGSLVVVYRDKQPEAGWKRETILVDEGENEIARGGNKLIAENSLLDRQMKSPGTYHIYTWTLPTDPEKAALIRVRRVHLCTIIVK